MGSKKGITGIIGLMAAAIIVIGGSTTVILAESTGTTNFLSTVGPSDTGPEEGGSGDPVEFRTVEWDSNDCSECYRVDLQTKAPVASSFKADIFNAQPDDDGDYGNPVDYDRSKATSGMTQGVDYFNAEGASTDTLTFPRSLEISSGTYDIAIVDNSSNPEYHDLFTEVNVPDTVKFTNYDNNNPVTIVSRSEFDRRAAYKSDSYSLLDSDGNNVDFADKDGVKDLATSAYSTDDETFTVSRKLDYEHGKDYLGEVNLLSVNGTSKATAELKVTGMVEQSGGSLKEEVIVDQTLAQNGAKEDFDTMLTENIEKHPEIVGDTLTADLEVNFDGTAVSDGWTIVNATIKDSYGNNVGSSPYISLTT